MLKLSFQKLLVICIVGCCAAFSGCHNNNSEEARISDNIYTSVKLPDNAHNLDEYSQYYTYGPGSLVTAIYVIHSENYREEVAKSCREDSVKEYPCNKFDFGIANSGKAKWVDSLKKLPSQNGGGCSYIHIIYDPRVSAFISVECNGPY